MPPDEYCIAEHFAKAGYVTGYIGKWHLDGFDNTKLEIARRQGNHLQHEFNNVEHKQGWQYWAGFDRFHSYWGRGFVYWEDGRKVVIPPKTELESDHQTDLAMKWIGQQQNNPWFMMLSWGPPHTPYHDMPRKYLDMFDPAGFKLRPNVRYRKQLDGTPLDEQYCRKELHGYYALGHILDLNVGRLMEFLRSNGLEENTIVIVTSDHGDLHMSHSLRSKGQPHEESINVPFIVRYPAKIGSGQINNTFFGSIDHYPTLCGLAGLDVPEGKDGIDLSGQVLYQTGKKREQAFLFCGWPDKGFGWCGMKTQDCTYAWLRRTRVKKAWTGRGRAYVLFNNKDDPYQMTNLVKEKGSRQLCRKMHGLLVDTLRDLKDPSLEEAEAYCRQI